MSSLAHLYGDLSAFAPAAHRKQAVPESAAGEDIRLAGYEDGYKAGWEDASRALEVRQQRLSGEILQRLQDLSFTYHEAYAKLSAAMAPLLSDMVTTFLPQVMQPALRAQLADQLSALIAEQGEAAIELATAPGSAAALEALMQDRTDIPFRIRPDPALGAGQLYLRVGAAEREINLDRLRDEVTAAIEAFLHATQQDDDHG